MASEIRHSLLASGLLEARAYQLEAVDETLSGSTLLVLPTAAGKTAVAWMVMAEMLRRTDGWALMIAPTVALVKQHHDGLVEAFSGQGIEAVAMSGAIPAAKRQSMWGRSRLVVSTPQVVRNDVIRGVLDLADCCVLVVDEAHHTTGERGEAQVADLYLASADEPLILGMTASPGSYVDRVEDVCRRLDVDRIHIRSGNEPMLAGHLANLAIEELRVAVPVEIRELAEPFVRWQEGIVDRERRLGRYVMSGPITHAGLANAMERANSAVRRGESDAYRSMTQIALAMTLHHLINHLLCQGTAAARQFLDRKAGSEDVEKKSTKNLLRDARIRSLRKSLAEIGEIHSKVGAVRRLVRDRLRRDEEARIIIFATFRDSVGALEKALTGLQDCRPIQFIGQSRKSSAGGLTPKQQVARIEAFRSGSANVLIATSVGEEGLDIPTADLVIFYEPVPSEIRTIQRRGRTGRHRDGDVVVLIAEDTRDEGARAAALRKEENMHRAVQRVRRSLSRSAHLDLSNLDEFSVVDDEEVISAADFVSSIREEHRPEIVEEDRAEEETRTTTPTILPPSTFRPRGQTGLEQFKSASKREESSPEPSPEASDSDAQAKTQTEPEPENQPANPVSIAQDLLALEESSLPDVPGSVIAADDRELNSAVVARLKALGAEVVIERLKTGDFRIGERILVERKTVRDFVDSLVDGRLLEQASRLVGAAPRSLILIEGEGLFHSTRVHPHALMGALTTLTLDFGIPVVTTKDGAETARFLAVASRREESMLDGLSPPARDRLEAVKPESWTDPVSQAAAGARQLRKRGDDDRAAARALLIAIPSVDDDLAMRLMDQFGTIAGLVWADEDEIRSVSGISETQVRELWRTFRSGERINQ
jgi:Fanconi anemia group M protein